MEAPAGEFARSSRPPQARKPPHAKRLLTVAAADIASSCMHGWGMHVFIYACVYICILVWPGGIFYLHTHIASLYPYNMEASMDASTFTPRAQGARGRCCSQYTSMLKKPYYTHLEQWIMLALVGACLVPHLTLRTCGRGGVLYCIYIVFFFVKSLRKLLYSNMTFRHWKKAIMTVKWRGLAGCGGCGTPGGVGKMS